MHFIPYAYDTYAYTYNTRMVYVGYITYNMCTWNLPDIFARALIGLRPLGSVGQIAIAIKKIPCANVITITNIQQ